MYSPSEVTCMTLSSWALHSHTCCVYSDIVLMIKNPMIKPVDLVVFLSSYKQKGHVGDPRTLPFSLSTLMGFDYHFSPVLHFCTATVFITLGTTAIWILFPLLTIRVKIFWLVQTKAIKSYPTKLKCLIIFFSIYGYVFF